MQRSRCVICNHILDLPFAGTRPKDHKATLHTLLPMWHRTCNKNHIASLSYTHTKGKKMTWEFCFPSPWKIAPPIARRILRSPHDLHPRPAQLQSRFIQEHSVGYVGDQKLFRTHAGLRINTTGLQSDRKCGDHLLGIGRLNALGFGCFVFLVSVGTSSSGRLSLHVVVIHTECFIDL